MIFTQLREVVYADMASKIYSPFLLAMSTYYFLIVNKITRESATTDIDFHSTVDFTLKIFFFFYNILLGQHSSSVQELHQPPRDDTSVFLHFLLGLVYLAQLIR